MPACLASQDGAARRTISSHSWKAMLPKLVWHRLQSSIAVPQLPPHKTWWILSKNPGRSLSLTAFARSSEVTAATRASLPLTQSSTSAKFLQHRRASALQPWSICQPYAIMADSSAAMSERPAQLMSSLPYKHQLQSRLHQIKIQRAAVETLPDQDTEGSKEKV